MASPAKALAPVALSPAEIEALAAEYRDLDAQIAAIDLKANEEIRPLRTRIDEVWELLIAQVRKYGSAHAEKSKLLYGVTLEVMGTFGSSSSADAAAVEAFRLLLVKAKKARLLKLIFEKTERWALTAKASVILLKAHAEKQIPNKLFIAFARCSVSKDRTPTLVVRERVKPA
jgi:hypothetical protein